MTGNRSVTIIKLPNGYFCFYNEMKNAAPTKRGDGNEKKEED